MEMATRAVAFSCALAMTVKLAQSMRKKRNSVDLVGGTSVGTYYLSDEQVEGAIFDCDGTLIDSMSAWLPSWQHACSKYDLEMTETKFWGFAGVPLPDIVQSLYSEAHGGERASDDFVEKFLKCKKAFHAEAEKKNGSPPAIECVISLVKKYKARGIPVAIASSGLRDIVERHCDHAGVLSLFGDKVVVAAEVPRGKPAPDVFLAAAKMIGADPKKCRAYEDGESGLEAAWRAGMHVVDVREMNGYPLNEGLCVAMKKQRMARTWGKF